jgi:hypothetical protein
MEERVKILESLIQQSDLDLRQFEVEINALNEEREKGAAL